MLTECGRQRTAAFFAAALFAVPSLSGAATTPLPIQRPVKLSYAWPLSVNVPVSVSYAKWPKGDTVGLQCWLKSWPRMLTLGGSAIVNVPFALAKGVAQYTGVLNVSLTAHQGVSQAPLAGDQVYCSLDRGLRTPLSRSGKPESYFALPPGAGAVSFPRLSFNTP
jgi:hypothetical protein